MIEPKGNDIPSPFPSLVDWKQITSPHTQGKRITCGCVCITDILLPQRKDWENFTDEVYNSSWWIFSLIYLIAFLSLSIYFTVDMGLFYQQSKRLLITKNLTKPSVYFFFWYWPFKWRI